MVRKNNKNNSFTVDDIKHLKSGNIALFEHIFKAYFQKLYEFSLFLIKDEQAAEDIVQDIFFYLWTHKENLKDEVNIESYLFSAVKNKSINYNRHQKVVDTSKEQIKITHADVEMPDETVQFKELEKAVNMAINSLPDKRKQIFYLHRFEKLTYKEIAGHLGISIKTVETQMRRSLKYLEKQLLKYLALFL